MDNGSPEQVKFVTSIATDIAVSLLQLQSGINDGDTQLQYHAQHNQAFERQNKNIPNAR